MKIGKTTMVLISLAAVWSWSSAPALAQRGRGAGGGIVGPGIHGGVPGSLPGQGPQHPQIEHPGTDHPQVGQAGRERGQEGRNTGSAETRPDTGRRSASEHLAENPKLSSKLQDLFPAGTNLQQQAAGFKNLGEFVSAAHVSHNLGIPFDQLRTRLTSGKSLGDAIHELKPAVDHQAEAKKARAQARKDLREPAS